MIPEYFRRYSGQLKPESYHRAVDTRTGAIKALREADGHVGGYTGDQRSPEGSRVTLRVAGYPERCRGALRAAEVP